MVFLCTLYIFKGTAHSTNGLWCEKSLWGFKAPHGARFIDYTRLFFEMSRVYSANKWEPKEQQQEEEAKNTRRRGEKEEEEKEEEEKI